MKRLIAFNLLLIFSFQHCSRDEINIDFNDDKIIEIKGADISYLPEVRASKLVFFNSENQPEDMLLTLKNSGANVVRLRLWKNPSECEKPF
jgi:arabinogalactan endo-1,4-beta-galactosidase